MSKSMIKSATVAELSAGGLRAILGLAVITALISASLFQRVRAAAEDVMPEAAGDLDPSFGTGGKVATDFGVPAVANAMAIQGDGKIIVAGVVQLPTGFDFGVARYNADGSLDTSFNSGGGMGSNATDFFGGDDRGFAIALQPDGKIVVGGTATTASGGFDFALARYNSNGTIDTSFGSGGKVTTDFSGKDDVIAALAIMPDGRIAAFGFATSPDSISHGAAAFYNADGSLTAKGTADATQANTVSAATVQPDGKVVVAGAVATQGPRDEFALARLTPHFENDASFGNSGFVSTDFGGNADAFAIALQPDGKIVAAGRSGLAGVVEFGVARYNADGSLDSSFGSGGKLRTSSLGSAGKPALANAVLLQPDNKIVAVGFSTPGAAGSDFTVVRFNPDGSLDSTFGSGGQTTTDFFGSDDGIRTAALQPDGKIVVAGFTTHTPGGPKQVAMARYLSGIAPGFSIGFDQSTVTADRGTKARVTVRINRTGGFTGNVTVTPPDPAGGIKPKPADPITTTDSSVVFKMKIGGGAAVGPHVLTFTAKDDSGKTQTAMITIMVQ